MNKRLYFDKPRHGKLNFLGYKHALGVSPNSELTKQMHDIFENAMQKYNLNLSVDLKFNDRMRSVAGKAFAKSLKIELNSRLFEKNPKELIPTFIHELAHIVARRCHADKVIKPHGIEWQKVMISLGQEPNRTHKLDVSELKHTHRNIQMYCNCVNGHMVTKRKRDKVLLGISKLYCKKCLSFLSVNR